MQTSPIVAACVCGDMWFQLPTTRKSLSLQAAQVVDRTSVGQLSTFRPILWKSKEHIPTKKIQGRICISKNNSINYTSQLHIHYVKKKLLVMKTSVVNFQNMMDMQKDYAYHFFNFVALKKLIRIRSNLSKQNQHEQNPKQNNF
jgi:hypothetical protein